MNFHQLWPTGLNKQPRDHGRSLHKEVAGKHSKQNGHYNWILQLSLSAFPARWYILMEEDIGFGLGFPGERGPLFPVPLFPYL